MNNGRYVADGVVNSEDYTEKDYSMCIEYQWSHDLEDYVEHRLTVYGDSNEEVIALAKKVCDLLNGAQ